MQPFQASSARHEAERAFARTMTALCACFDVAAEHRQEILKTGCLRVGEVNVLVRPDATGAAIEILVDLGIPEPRDALGVYRAVLEGNFEDASPGWNYGVNAKNGRLFALCTLHPSMVDEEGRLVCLMLGGALAHGSGLRGAYAFES